MMVLPMVMTPKVIVITLAGVLVWMMIMREERHEEREREREREEEEDKEEKRERNLELLDEGTVASNLSSWNSRHHVVKNSNHPQTWKRSRAGILPGYRRLTALLTESVEYCRRRE